jgi:DNA repair protein RecO (recombination protein O)
MLGKTKGIVLRRVKYGESSLIVSVFTERFGLQSYMVRGVQGGKQRSKKANLLFPSSLLDMVVYHHDQKNLQIIKEMQPLYFFAHLSEDVLKNGVAVFAIEVLTQLLIAGDVQESLFQFTEDFLVELNQAKVGSIANFPLFFLIRSGLISGYHLLGRFSEQTPFADIREGRFSAGEPILPPFVEKENAKMMDLLSQATTVEEIQQIRLGNQQRREILDCFLQFYQFHLPHFRSLKSVAVLSAILS